MLLSLRSTDNKQTSHVLANLGRKRRQKLNERSRILWTFRRRNNV